MAYDTATKHGHTHGEAFMIMWYACKCGHRERIWNSRDGVTPFGALCPSCGGTMSHVDWGRDEYAPDHKPARYQRYWRDGTPDEAEAIMRRRIEGMRGGPYEASSEVVEELIASARAGENEFQPGWPMLSEAA